MAGKMMPGKMMTGRILLLGLVGLIGPLGAAPPALAEPATRPVQAMAPQTVTARAGAHVGFGRIVFDWPQPVGYTAEISNNRLKIVFERPMRTVLGSVRRNLADYIERVALAPDGKSVTAVLKGSLRLRTFARQNRVVVDLVRRDGATQAATVKTPEPGVAASKRPTPLRRRVLNRSPAGGGAVAGSSPLVVRSGSHGGYGRLVFEWDHRVGYRVDRKGRDVSIRFDRPARVDGARLRRILPPQISSAKAQHLDRGLRIGLVVADGARVRHFRDGNNVVVDILGKPAPALHTPTARNEAQTARNAAKAEAEVKPAKPEKPKQAAPAIVLKPLKAVSNADRFSERVRALARKRRIEKARKQQNAPGALVTVDAVQIGSETSIRFNWRKSVAAAVYRRNNVLWIVFDRSRRIDVPSVRVAGKVLFKSVEQLWVPDVSVLRLAMASPYEVSAKRDGTTWIVTVGPEPKPAARPSRVSTDYTSRGGARIVVEAKDAKHAIRLHDPDLGDMTYVIPLAASSLGTPSGRRFLDFELLATAQGIVVAPIADKLQVRVARGRVTIGRSGGLLITRKIELVRHKPKKILKKMMDFAAWRMGPAEDYQKIKNQLLRRIVTTHGRDRNGARLDLARFYVANGMGAEALGVLRALLRDSPSHLRDLKIRALRGVAAYQIGHFAEALEDLRLPALKRNPEILPWLAGIAVARGDWRGAYRLFEDTEHIIKSYPTDMATKFAVMAAEAALSVEDDDTAAGRLEELEQAELTKAQIDHLTYLRGYLAKKLDKIPEAISLWETVAAIGDRPSRAKAAFARINALLEQKEIKPKEAIEKLQALRFAWRNDVFEFDLLHQLGRLYADQKDYRNALLILRQAATYYSDIQGTEALTAEMSEVFRKFYTEGEADRQPPISALGIYQEFRELTPSGADGDRLIARLAERMIKVDLLSQAGDLIEHLVVHRLKGLGKAEAGLRLANIRLMDRAPQKALEALAKSDYPDIPAALKSQRRHVRVVALSKLGKPDQALKVIAAESSDAADMLRTDILWNATRWRAASRILARLTGGFDTARIDRKKARLLLQRAVALGLSKDTAGIEFLRERFGKAMAKTAYAEAFRAVVGNGRIDTDDYRVLARKASELELFVAFQRKGMLYPKNPAPAIN